MSAVIAATTIPYLGDMPAGWRILRNRAAFECSKLVVGSASSETQLLSLSTKGIREKDINNPDGKLPATFDTYQYVEKGQLVLCLFDLDQSAVFAGRSPFHGMISPAYTVLSCRAEILPEFADYWFAYVFIGRKFSYFAKNIRYTMSWDDFAQMYVPAPTLAQQARIVRFLDVETAKIDHLIAKQRELLDLLNLRHEARWHAAFTGFTPVKTRPLKRLLVKQNRPVVEGTGVVTAFRDGEVTLRSKRREEGFTFSETEAGYQGIKQDDLVFHGLDGFAGAVGISDSDGQSTPVYHVCRQRDGEDNLRFIAYALRYLGHSGFLATQAPSVRQRAVDFRNWQTFGQVPLSLPDGGEQQRIVADLDSHAAALADAKGTIERAIALLQERRSALITAAVTGQIEV